MAKVTVAQFTGGHCTECGDPIMKGDQISPSGHLWLHAECNDSTEWDDRELTGWRDED